MNEIAGGWNGDHHDGVPIFVLTRRPPDGGAPDWPLVTYVTDVATAMARAKDAAGDRNVLVHGARTAQLALAAGVLDELEIHQIPVLLGKGRRLFDHLGPDHIELSTPESSTPPASPTSTTASAVERAATGRSRATGRRRTARGGRRPPMDISLDGFVGAADRDVEKAGCCRHSTTS